MATTEKVQKCGQMTFTDDFTATVQCKSPCPCPKHDLPTEPLDLLTRAFKVDRWVQPGKAAQLALTTLRKAGFTIERRS